MSDEDIQMGEDHLALEAWESERDQAVILLNDAADRLEGLAGMAIIAPWSSYASVVWAGKDQNIQVAKTDTSWCASWIAAVGPQVAPFLAGWLRHTARVAAVLERSSDFAAYVDRKALGLAQHVMASQ